MTRSVDVKRCVRCGRCVTSCPMGILKCKEGPAAFTSDAEDLCIYCGHCIAACPEDAVCIAELPAEMFPTLHGAAANIGQLQELFDGRRSIREFEERPVEREKIERILTAVATTPVACGGNPPPVTVINGRERVAKLIPPMMEFYRKFSKGMTSPLFRPLFRLMMGKHMFKAMSEFMPMVTRMVEYYDATGNDCMTWGAPSLLLFHTPPGSVGATFDPVICCTYAMIAAHAQGLGTTMIGMAPPFINKNPCVKKELGIPAGNNVLISLIVGYPTLRYSRGIRRTVAANWVE